jgi:hypothetical protein
MQEKIAKFIALIDAAIMMVAQMQSAATNPNSPEDLARLMLFLNNLKATATAGKLEPSAGVVTLGLSRGVTEWLEPQDSPLYPSIGEIERFYRQHL